MAIGITEEQHWEAIREACFYKRTKFYFPFANPKVYQLPGNKFKILSDYSKKSAFDLGVLDNLPTEILEGILLRLDIESFRIFRNANRRARYFAADLPVYKRVLEHGAEAIGALKRTGLSKHVSYGQVDDALVTSDCQFCGDFGNFLFLPTAKRCCFECLRTSRETAVVSEEKISKRKPWHRRYIANYHGLCTSLANVRSLSIDWELWHWDRWDSRYKKIHGVLAKDLVAAYVKIDKNLEQYGQELLQTGWLHYRVAASIIFPTLNVRTNTVKEGLSCKGCEDSVARTASNYYNFVQTGDQEIFSLKCRIADLSYAGEGLKEHFRECRDAQRIWSMSEKERNTRFRLSFYSRVRNDLNSCCRRLMEV
ncbi:hypothetical protein IL306_011366 [Fusarium sp. DS 682]|nr:hypothetical protein IL306_011366 [Fusarium sp. DS 682]